ncbi:COG1361 family protein [Streptomyces massasporeus]|uniref:hypothetical protein n=1 Tax=Streptomyces massasporeus TaxID=67324 RepID=UPI003710CFF1
MVIEVVIETAAHPWEFGWDALVAIGTLVLAAFTWRLAARTRQLAKETAADQRAQWRPVLIPHHNTPEELDSGNPLPAVKFKRVAEHLSVYVRNAGRGPALHVRAQLQGELTLANPWDWSIGALAPGDVQELYFLPVPGAQSALQVLLDYRDLAGRSYSTSITIRAPRGQDDAYFFDVRNWENHTVTSHADTPYPLPGLKDVSPKPPQHRWNRRKSGAAGHRAAAGSNTREDET